MNPLRQLDDQLLFANNSFARHTAGPSAVRNGHACHDDDQARYLYPIGLARVSLLLSSLVSERMAGSVSSGSAFCSLVEDVLDGLMDQRDDVGVDDSVEDVSSVSSSFDPAGEAQLGKMLADPRFGASDGVDEGGDVDLVVGQEPEQMEPNRGAEQLEDLGGVGEGVPVRGGAAGCSCHWSPHLVASNSQ